MIKIDGSFGEGGGQIVRTAVALAAMTGRAVEITKLRERRERPGLQRQHLAAVRAAADLCAADLSGDVVGSRHLVFSPTAPVRAGEFVFDIGTAGAATLVLQTVLIPLLGAGEESSVEVVGGTYQPMSPSVDYLERVYVPALRRFGARVDVDHSSAGYYPRGGGRLHAIVSPSRLTGIDLVERGPRVSLDAIVVTSGLADQVADRGVATIRERVPEARPVVRTPPAFSRGAAVTIVATHECGLGGFSSIGRPGLPMENVAAETCDLFIAWDESGAACDERLADQLVLPATLAEGRSRWATPRITQHLLTVLEVVREFTSVECSIEGNRIELVPSAGVRSSG